MKKEMLLVLAVLSFIMGFCCGLLMINLVKTLDSETTTEVTTEIIATETDVIATELDAATETDVPKEYVVPDYITQRIEEYKKQAEENQKRYEEIVAQKETIETIPAEVETVTSQEPETVYTPPAGDGVLTKSKGVNYGPSGKETYYNLPMGGVINIAQSQGIEGEYWVREDGCKMYGEYIICAANLDVHPRGSLVESSLGTCIVLDTGGFAASDPNQLDIATDW